MDQESVLVGKYRDGELLLSEEIVKKAGYALAGVARSMTEMLRHASRQHPVAAVIPAEWLEEENFFFLSRDLYMRHDVSMIVIGKSDGVTGDEGLRKPGVFGWLLAPVQPVVLRAVIQQAKERQYLEREYRLCMEKLESLRRESRRTDSDIRRRSLWYRQMIDGLSESMLLVDGKGNVVDVNQAAIQMYGYEREGFVGKNLTELHICSGECVLFSADSKIEGNCIEAFHRNRDGRIFPVELQGSAVWDQDEEYTLWLVRDITRRKEQERVLQITEQKFATAFRFSPEPMLIITAGEGRIVEYNHSFLQFVNQPTSDIHNVRCSDMEGWESTFWQDFLLRMAEEQQILQEEKNFFFTNVKRTAVLSAETLELDGEDSIVIMFHDVSERKEMEQMLQQRNRELKEALDSLQKTHMQLIQQEKLASIGQLAAGVAHEINNPLGFINSNFDTLRKYVQTMKEIIFAYRDLKNEMEKNSFSNEVNAFISKIYTLEKEKRLSFILEDLEELFAESKEGLERVSKIVVSLRSFARTDAQTEWEEYNLNEGLRVALLLGKNEIKYHAQIKQDLQDLPPIEGIGGQINQVLLNIIVNAAQAIAGQNREAMGLIHVSSWQEGDYVCCSIGDNGGGISKENRERIFEPFFTTKPVGQGTGLGLSISYDIIVAKHQGEILVDSEDGVGTTFTLRLPIRQKRETREEKENLSGTVL